MAQMNDDPTEDWVWDPKRSCFLKPSLFDGQWNIAKVPVFELGNPIYQYDPKRHRIYQDVLREQEKMEQAQVMQQQQTQSPQRETTVGWSVYANAPKPAATQQPESWGMGAVRNRDDTRSGNYAERFSYGDQSILDPKSWKYTPLAERNYQVMDSQGNYLFSLGNPNVPVEVISYRTLHKSKIQWFAETADNYMPLYDVSPNIEKLETIHHMHEGNTNEFISRDFPLEAYESGGSGDWKSSPEGANGALLSEINGYPIRADAIGQLPYAVGAYRFFSKYLPEELAVEAAKLGGSVFATGKNPLYWKNWDFSNSYDNYMIEAGIQYERARTGNDFNRMRYLDKMGQDPFDPRNPVLNTIPSIPVHVDGDEFKYSFPKFKKQTK